MDFDETFFQLFKRMRIEPMRTGLKPFETEIRSGGLRPGNVVELVGASGTGKSEILMQIMANCVLPKKWDDVEIGGNEGGVVLFDNDFHFDLFRFSTILEHRVNASLRSAGHAADLDSLESFIRSCLHRLHIIRSRYLPFFC